MKTVISKTNKIINRAVKAVVFIAACAVSYAIFSQVVTPPDFFKLWQAYVSLTGSSYEIINSAILISVTLVITCIVGCNIQLKKSAGLKEITEKLNQFEHIVEIAKVIVNQYEEFMFTHYNYVDRKTIEKVAPAKSILSALEKRLNNIQLAAYKISSDQLNEMLDERILFSASPAAIKILSNSSLAKPKNLNFVECAYILNQIFDSVKVDLEQAEVLASESKYHRSSYKSLAKAI